MNRFVLVASLALSSTALAGAPNFLPIPPSVIKEVETGKPASASAAQQEQARIATLREKALNTDPSISLPAIRELKGMGASARPTLIGVVRTVLSRDQGAAEQAIAGIGDGKEASQYEAQIDALRKEARENIPKLDKSKPETIKKAHEFYEQLMPMTAKMNQAWGLRLTILNTLSSRPELIRIWREIAPTGDKSFTIESEARLKSAAVRAVGDFVDRAAELEWGKPPKDDSLRPLWFYGMCRKIEAWNNSVMEKFMDPEEIKNLQMVNAYREAIGLLPYEADPRLVQSARRHSKDMVDKDFFSHESPSPGLKTFGDRCKAAGYQGGSGENIAYGPAAGEPTFWMWFDSPGHHQNMAGGSSALGVGRWHNRFTQNFGGGPRIMLMSQAEREAVKIEGAVLAPDTGRTTK